MGPQNRLRAGKCVSQGSGKCLVLLHKLARILPGRGAKGKTCRSLWGKLFSPALQFCIYFFVWLAQLPGVGVAAARSPGGAGESACLLWVRRTGGPPVLAWRQVEGLVDWYLHTWECKRDAVAAMT